MTKIELFRDRAGQWRFRVIARNGRTVAASEAYTRKASARKAAQRMEAIILQARVVMVSD